MTEETFQVEMSWSKEEAPENIKSMLVTEETSQAEMSWLKEERH